MKKLMMVVMASVCALGLLADVSPICLKATSAAGAGVLPFADGERIAFLGDSITQLGTDDPRGWVNHVERAIRAETPEVSFIQAGISGHTSRDMLARVNRDVLSRKPNWMFFSCGVNDAPNGFTDARKNADVPLAEYRVNVSKIFDMCDARGVKVIVLSQTPVLEDPDHVANANLVAYNAALKELALKRGYRYLDPGAAIRAAIARKADKSTLELTVDGTHLSDVGNRIYADTVLKGLRTVRTK